MKVRTFLIIVVFLGLLYGVVSIFLANSELLEREFLLWGDTRLRVGWMLVGSFATGLGIALILGLSRELGVMVERWRQRKASRKTEQIEEEYSRGLVAVLEGREDEALRHFRAVLQWDSRHFNTLIKLGEVLRSRGKHADAIEFHRKAHHLKEDSTRPLYALVEDHEAQGDMDRARAVVGRIIALDKGSVAAWRKLRALHVKEANWERALEAHERVERLSDPGSPVSTAEHRFGLGIRYEIASTKLAAGKTREALGGLRRLLKDTPSFIPAHVALGGALRSEGREADAAAAWTHGFDTTGSPIFLTLLEDLYLSREQPLAAIEALKSCISGSRKDTLARFYLGKLYFRLEMLDDALSVLTSLEGRAAHAPTLHYLLGRIHDRRQNHAEAASQYRQVIKQLDLVSQDYKCRACSGASMAWAPRCSACGEWNTVEVDFREEISLEQLGLAPAPIYSSHD